MKIAILTNGSISNYEFYKPKLKEYDLIICADGGLAHAYEMGVLPHVALGDFDSTSAEILEYYRARECKIIEYSAIKNETDTEIAINYALDQKPEKIDILAGLGSRFDHSLANVHLLKKGLGPNIPIGIITENHEIRIIDSNVHIKGDVGDGVSLLPLTPVVSGVFTSGLAYPVEEGEFSIGEPYGVSNYMSGPVAHITIKTGLLLVIKYWE